MRHITFVLKKKDKQYYFSNTKTGSENELFSEKSDGVRILLGLCDNGIITKCHALTLLEAIIAIREMPIGPLCVDEQLESDLFHLAKILEFRDKLRELTITETKTDLPKFKVCPNCGLHGKIVGSDFISRELRSKQEANEAITAAVENGKITRQQEKKLRREVDATKLMVLHEENSQLN